MRNFLCLQKPISGFFFLCAERRISCSEKSSRAVKIVLCVVRKIEFLLFFIFVPVLNAPNFKPVPWGCAVSKNHKKNPDRCRNEIARGEFALRITRKNQQKISI